jgi:hypothetical protein
MPLQYDDAPDRRDTLVSLDEAYTIMNGDLRTFAKSADRVAHYAGRVYRTLQAHRDQIQSLHRDIQTIQMSRAIQGAAPTMSPVDAVKYLTPDQLADAVDGASGARIRAASATVRQAQELRADTLARINEIKLLFTPLLTDARFDAAVRDSLSEVIRHVSESAVVLSTPAPVPPPDLDSLFS